MNKNLFDEEAANNLFNQVSKIWIEPEIKRRQILGKITDKFTWSSCRILFPKKGPHEIEFNKEIRWQAIIKKAPHTSFKVDQAVYVYELQKVIDVLYPKIRGEHAGFIYIEFSEGSMKITFNLSPTHDNYEVYDDRLGTNGSIIVDSIQREIDLKVIKYCNQLTKSLREIGLWIIPSLIPYPLSKIAKEIGEKNLSNAQKIFLEYGNSEFIKKLIKRWENSEFYYERKKVFEEALFCHKNGKYVASIHLLSPHIEGVITDFLHSQFNHVPNKIKDRIKKFLEQAYSNEDSAPFVFKKLLDSLNEFLLEGPIIKQYKWLDTIENIFPNRHVVGHGRYDESLYNEENSLKMFLILESIHYILTNMPLHWTKK